MRSLRSRRRKRQKRKALLRSLSPFGRLLRSNKPGVAECMGVRMEVSAPVYLQDFRAENLAIVGASNYGPPPVFDLELEDGRVLKGCHFVGIQDPLAQPAEINPDEISINLKCDVVEPNA